MKTDLIHDGKTLGEAILKFFEGAKTFVYGDGCRFAMSSVWQVELTYTPSIQEFYLVLTNKTTLKRTSFLINLPSVRQFLAETSPKPCDYSDEIDLSDIEISDTEPVRIGEMLIKFGRAMKKEYIIQQIAFNRHLQGHGMFSGLIGVWESWFRAHPDYQYNMRMESILNEHLERALKNRPGWTIRYDGSAVYDI
jgi:hypothetical protein